MSRMVEELRLHNTTPEEVAAAVEIVNRQNPGVTVTHAQVVSAVDVMRDGAHVIPAAQVEAMEAARAAMAHGAADAAAGLPPNPPRIEWPLHFPGGLYRLAPPAPTEEADPLDTRFTGRQVRLVMKGAGEDVAELLEFAIGAPVPRCGDRDPVKFENLGVALDALARAARTEARRLREAALIPK